ncbi:hypothetical protein BC332_29549 [Capsicum chinense]|nr:hypothetical protein BC332_29549 [Capsicum chinense]
MMYNGKSRHIRRRHNTVRELLSSGIITVDYVKLKDNGSDPLTKGLSREGVERTSKGMGLRPGQVSMAVTLPSRLEIPRARFKDQTKLCLTEKMTNESQIQDAATTVGANSIASTSRANAPQPMAPTEKPRKCHNPNRGPGRDEHSRTVKARDALCLSGLIVNDAFQVEVIIEKQQPMWKDFKNYLKHKHKEMTVEDLIVRLCIEEDNKAVERSSKENSTINGAHIVEDDQKILIKGRKSNKEAINPRINSRESASTVARLARSPRIVMPQRKAIKRTKQI